jgi:hypothetical protein
MSADQRGSLLAERFAHEATKASRDLWRVLALFCMAGYVVQMINVYVFGVKF